jgi:hypothetical protein
LPCGLLRSQPSGELRPKGLLRSPILPQKLSLLFISSAMMVFVSNYAPDRVEGLNTPALLDKLLEIGFGEEAVLPPELQVAGFGLNSFKFTSPPSYL